MCRDRRRLEVWNFRLKMRGIAKTKAPALLFSNRQFYVFPMMRQKIFDFLACHEFPTIKEDLYQRSLETLQVLAGTMVIKMHYKDQK